MHSDQLGNDSSLPPGSITSSDMAWNRTGNWRYLRPRFVRKFAPCSEGCPAGNDIEGMLVLAGQGRYGEALSRLLEESPFPGVCGRVCYHPCESACNRNVLDTAVSIQAMERFVSEWRPVHEPVPGSDRSARVAVVGAGPAGLTCAYHLRRLGYQVRVFEKESTPGGMLRMGIPKYRLPREVLDREIARIMDLGIELETSFRVGRDTSWDALVAAWDAVFLGCGAHGTSALNIPGEHHPGVSPGTSFLEAVNSGRDINVRGRVAVIGGGNTAIDCARAAIRLGSEPVVLYRRSREEMPAIESEVDEALGEGVEIRYLTSPMAVQSSDEKITGLECVRNRLAEPDRGGRAFPEPIEGSEFFVECDAVITAVGEAVELKDLPGGLQTKHGVVAIDPWGKTSLDKVWAGGDAATDPRMVVHAIGAGKRAALSIHASLTGEDLDSIAGDIRIGFRGSFSMERYVKGSPPGAASNGEVVAPEQINLDHFEPITRTAARERDPTERVQDFHEIQLGFDEEQASREATRCFHCGACDRCGICRLFCPDFSIVLGEGAETNILDEFHCKGCGICAQECPRSAIVMERER